MSRIANVVVVVAVIQALAGCGSPLTQPDDGGGGVSDPGAGLVALEQVTGIVNDSTLRPLAGVVVEVLDGPQAGTTATTNAKGEFVLTATSDTGTRFGVSKDGYITAIRPARSCDVCSPRRSYFVFVLESLAPSVNLAGNYTLTFIADSACTAIPSAWRTRTYAATIVSVPDSAPYPAGTFFEATAPGVRYPFGIATAGDSVLFLLLSGEWGPSFMEEVAPGEYVAFNTLILFSVGSASVSTVSASFGGTAEYWGPGVGTPVHCESANHRMTLTKR